MDIGSKVITEHGSGVIIGNERPDECCFICLVRLKDGRQAHYFRSEIAEEEGES